MELAVWILWSGIGGLDSWSGVRGLDSWSGVHGLDYWRGVRGADSLEWSSRCESVGVEFVVWILWREVCGADSLA